MRTQFNSLRIKQLDRSLGVFRRAAVVPRPGRGWVRAVRKALGVPAREVAQKLGGSVQLVLQQERAEAEDRITLKSLRKIANALDCDLVYGLVPRRGSLQSLMQSRARAEATHNVLEAEHTMLLENQAAGRLEEAIALETDRILSKRAGVA